jgi:hypothetical protein
MTINIGLVFLRLSLVLASKQARLRVSSEFADDQRLVIIDIPLSYIRRFWMTLIPADLLVHANNIERLRQRIIHDLCVSVGSDQQGGGN